MTDDPLAIARGPRDAKAFAEAAVGFLVDAEILEAQLRGGSAYNVFHAATMTKVDLFPAIGRFERNQLRRATERAGVPVISAEDAILAKLRWYKLGGERSERQWRDVLGILTVKGPALDLDHLRTWAAELDVGKLLHRALEDRSGGF